MTDASKHAEDAARQRLLELARERRVSLAALSEMINRNSSYLQQFIRKGSPRKLEERDRRTLAEFFGVDERELGAPQEKSYLRLSEADGSPRRPLRQASEQTIEWVEVPRLDLGASAGPGALGDGERVFDGFRFSRRWLREQGLDGARLSAIRVEGDSMEPLLRDGDEILVDLSERPFRDGVHVVRIDDNLLVKRVAQTGPGRFALLSQNLAYPPLEVEADSIEIIGRVVWKAGRI